MLHFTLYLTINFSFSVTVNSINSMMMMMMMMSIAMLVYSGQALISGDALQPTTYTGLPQYPGLGGFGTLPVHFYSRAFCVNMHTEYR